MNPDLLKYFTSPAAAAEFALLYTEGDTYRGLLGITRLHYRDTSAATDWAAQFVDLPMSSAAHREVDAIYQQMIER